MGMFNEVIDVCPECGKRCGYMQIHQIVLGFGGFDLSALASIKSRHERGELSQSD